MNKPRNTKRKTPRRPGRPAAQTADIRQALLAAARQLFAAHDFDAVSSREIAENAGANPAMIHYYFQDKRGLYETMLRDTVAPLLEKLEALSQGHPGDDAVLTFLENYTRTLAANPWIPKLIVREVLSETGRFRERFVSQFASRGGGLLKQLLDQRKADGRLRPDCDPTLGALSLISLALFPFIAMPVIKQVFGVEPDAAFVKRLIEHNHRLFERGANAGES